MRKIILILCICLNSCINDSQVLHQNVVDLPFEEMAIEPLVGNPYQIAVIDNTLVLADNVEGKALLLYNLENKKSHRVLDIGQGPYEVLTPLDFDVYKNELTILQRRTGECRDYDVNELLYDANPEYQKTILDNSDRCCKTDYGYVFMGFDERNIFSFFNAANLTFSSVDFDEFVLEDSSVKYKLLQGKLAYLVQSKTLVYAPSYSSYIKFYIWENDGWKIKTSFQIGKNIIEKRIVEKNHLDLYKKDIRHCLDVCASNNYFYILYDGMELENMNTNNRYILKFDINGKYICSYKVNPTIQNICVSKDKIIYALMLSEKDKEPIIGKAVIE